MGNKTLILLVATLPFLSGCADMITPDPLGAQTSELESIRAALDVIMARLDSIDADQSEHYADLSASIDSVHASVRNISVEVGGGASVGASVQLDASLCGSYGIQAAAKMTSTIELRAKGEGTVGVDAYGNGGTGQIQAFGGQIVGVTPQGGVEGELEVCARLIGTGGVEAGVTVDATDAVFTLLGELQNAVNPSQLASLATSRNMTGARASQALDGLSSLSLSTVPFGGGGASSLVNALPLPGDIANVINDPASLFDGAGEAAAFALDHLCGTTLRIGQFANVVQSGCDLRNDMPAPAEIVDIFRGLDGLPLTLSTLQSSVSGLEGSVLDLESSVLDLDSSVSALQTAMTNVCSTVGSMSAQRINIPSRSITIGNQSYTTFPGYNAALFPSIGPPSC